MTDSIPPPDHVRAEPDDVGHGDESRVGEHIKSSSTWLRLLFMILFFALWSISRIVVFAVVVLQFFWVLVVWRGESAAASSRSQPGNVLLSDREIPDVRYR